MKPIKEETKNEVKDLSKEELQNTFGGAWWEVIYENGKFILVFHPYKKP